jgi:drug/metabolite transporter (DMT)-like permease
MKHETKGQLTILLSNLLFAIAAICVKLISGSINSFFISLFRFFTGIIFLVFILIMTKKYFTIKNKKDWLLRGLFGASAMTLYYFAIQLTSSGRATLLVNTFPVFVALFGYLFFHEKITFLQIISLLLCIAGAFFVFYDGSGYLIFGDILGIIASILAGLSIHYTKRLRENNNPMIIYLSVCLFGLAFNSFSVTNIVSIDIITLGILFLIGVLAFSAQISLTYGIKFITPTKASIITFSKIPFTIILSLFIGEEMNERFFIGMGLILIGLFLNRKG